MQNKSTKSVIDPKYILLAISIVSLVLVVLSFAFQDKMTPVRSVVGSVVTPMQKGISQIGSMVSDKMDYVTNLNRLVRENKKLQSKLDEISSQNKLLQQDKYELDNFRKLYDLDQQYASYPKVAARVISSNSDNWYNTFIIDKGSKDGIAVNMNVMAGDGLVGIVTQVNKSYAKVRSIVDDNSNVVGSFLKTSDGCFISGNLSHMNDGVIDVTNVPKDAQVGDGYAVVTSQISEKYLPGILIGYVRDLKTDDNNLTKSGLLTPAADFSSLQMVLVITKVKDSKDLEAIQK